MVKILDKIMMNVMMAVLTLSSTLDVSAAGSRFYFEYNGLCYRTHGLFLSSSYAIVTYPDDKSDFNQDFYAVGDIIIPSTIQYDGWTIPVKRIDNHAFSNCQYLTSVKLPEGLEVIGYEAFSNCGLLQSIDIPESVQKIEGRAFARCESLQSVKFPQSMTSIGEEAFLNCESLSSASLPNDISSIGASTFERCSLLKTVSIPRSVKEIGDEAFLLCESLESVAEVNGVEKIGASAFLGCCHLKSINIGDKLTYLGENAFEGCNSLESLGNNAVVPGIQYSEYVHDFPYSHGLRIIASSAFRNCFSLTSVKLADDVQAIGTNAFSGCASLRSINIPSGVKTIYDEAFAGCISLPKLTLPHNIQNFYSKAFYACNGLKSINIPANTSHIDNYAFVFRSAAKVHAESEVPPALEHFPPRFSAYTKENGILYVPDGSVQTYREAYEWKEFKNIADESSSGIENVEVSNLSDSGISVTVGPDGIHIDGITPGSTVSIYTLDGTRCFSDSVSGDRMTYHPATSGIYIIRIGEYSTKVLLR